MDIVLKNLDIKVKVIDFSNGFKIYYINDETSDKYSACINCFYGGSDLNIGSILPPGIAHFIEHMMFNMRDSSNPFEFYNRSSCDVNATTSYDVTKYFIMGKNNFYDNLDYLINLVFDPVFDKCSIDKERMVINEEINMYLNDPCEKFYHSIISNFYNSLEYSNDIIGTKDSISLIDEDLLYKTYDYFYKPSNMALFIKGNNIDLDRVISLFNNNVYFNKRNGVVNKFMICESDFIKNNNIIVKGDVLIDKANILFKINISKFNYDKYILRLYFDIFLRLLFSSISDFYEDIINDSNISDFNYVMDIKGDYLIIDISCESKCVSEFKDIVLNYINNYSICENDFDRVKKILISNEIRLSENKTWVLDNISNDINKYDRIIDNKLDIINKLDYKEFNDIINRLCFDNYLFAILKK